MMRRAGLIRGAGVALAGVLSLVVSFAARAAPALPEGTKAITLISGAGEKLVIGHVTFAKDGDGATFALKMDAPEFQDEFLSMRPFRCAAGDKETWCHLEYPYDLKRRITADDLADLEYSLLFLWKPPSGYGIDTWNGLYFKLALGDDGTLGGPVHDVNLEPLGVPPADRSARTISPADLNPADAASHRFARVEVR
jgi:hypothetical protein